jgi:predicted Zn-dependent protease
MSLKESKEVKPLRIKAVTVRRNDTVASLARRMATDHALERFRVLNGLGAHDRVKPGDVVKIVE